MTRIRVETEIAAPPSEVWADVRDVKSHVEWMHDAADITFTGEQVEGVGTTFDCLTVLGPLRLTDRMEITSWTCWMVERSSWDKRPVRWSGWMSKSSIRPQES